MVEPRNKEKERLAWGWREGPSKLASTYLIRSRLSPIIFPLCSSAGTFNEQQSWIREGRRSRIEGSKTNGTFTLFGGYTFSLYQSGLSWRLMGTSLIWSCNPCKLNVIQRTTSIPSRSEKQKCRAGDPKSLCKSDQNLVVTSDPDTLGERTWVIRVQPSIQNNHPTWRAIHSLIINILIEARKDRMGQGGETWWCRRREGAAPRRRSKQGKGALLLQLCQTTRRIEEVKWDSSGRKEG